MKKSHMVNAWCLRPFITSIDVEADSPEAAIEIARHKTADLLDAAEECSSAYPWDEFSVFDEGGKEILCVLDEPARVRNEASTLLSAAGIFASHLEATPYRRGVQ